LLDAAEIPALDAGEVLVRNAVIFLNPVDGKVLSALADWRLDHVPGIDGARIVAAVATRLRRTGWDAASPIF
jgi:NADPH:quinone reductase-like Zn-dependent oxidoreductase